MAWLVDDADATGRIDRGQVTATTTATRRSMYGHVVQSEAELCMGHTAMWAAYIVQDLHAGQSAFNRPHHRGQGLATDKSAATLAWLTATYACPPSQPACCICVPPLDAENKLCSCLLVCLCIGLIKQSPLEDLLVLLCSTIPGAVTLHAAALDALQAATPTNPAQTAATMLGCDLLEYILLQ